MNLKRFYAGVGMRGVLLILCSAALAAGGTLSQVAAAQSAGGTAGNAPALIPPDQLDSLVAPIALYPDPLVAQVLAASTYPLEIIQLQQWLTRNPGLKDQALADALLKEPWDPSVESLAATPELVKRLADDIQWTTDLGNAFLAQEGDVMDAIQRMRKKAMDKNVLKTTEQQVVQTKVVETKTVVIIEPANPQVVYVPTYSPVVVWGPPIYPYPPIYYPPPPPPGYLALSFGIGVAMGYWWGGGGWGYNCGWGHNTHITINNNNTYIRNVNARNGNVNIGNGNVNIGNGNRINNSLPNAGNGGNRWQHRPEHRGGAPYRDRATADKFGGAARGDSLANRQANARNQLDRQGGNLSSNRPAGGGNRVGTGAGGAGGGNRVGTGAGGASGGNRIGAGTATAGGGNRVAGGTGTAGAGGVSAGAGNRAGGSAGTGNRAGGADRVGGRDLSSGSGGANRNAFGGGGGTYNGAGARASSSRGAASMQSRGGGNAQAGGGARRK